MSNEMMAVACLVVAVFGIMLICLVRMKAMLEQEVEWMNDRLTDTKVDTSDALAGIRRTLDGLTKKINELEKYIDCVNRRLVDVEDVVIVKPSKKSRKKEWTA